ncbi:unnamed protein product [Amoebophrya sp. A120]|nr:unnamed protein product [Amoebophrya sp. A120]|eukprot:GSA120T00011468001.1
MGDIREKGMSKDEFAMFMKPKWKKTNRDDTGSGGHWHLGREQNSTNPFFSTSWRDLFHVVLPVSVPLAFLFFFLFRKFRRRAGPKNLYKSSPLKTRDVVDADGVATTSVVVLSTQLYRDGRAWTDENFFETTSTCSVDSTTSTSVRGSADKSNSCVVELEQISISAV